MSQVIQNPILPGFNPDPSVIRVGDDFYIATSTFEWFPGVRIHHSRDLVNWRLVGHVLTRSDQLDMRGFNNSDGVYAPALSHADGKFWLTFSCTHNSRGGAWMSTPCYVVTAESIEGPWSDPVAIGGGGFDPSLFHDDDGRKWVVNMTWDGRSGHDKFGDIVVQEFDAAEGKLKGKRVPIFAGTELGCTEGPQILKKNGYYYLITAEGGTEWNHAVTVCRSTDLFGPYEVHPQKYILSSRFQEENPLQRSGHGFFVDTPNGEWYLTHLCGRPVYDPDAYAFGPKYATGFSILGRETAIQKVEWRDGWPWLACGGNAPQMEVPAPDLPAHPWPTTDKVDNFDSKQLSSQWQTLREPAEESWCSLTQKPGHLRLIGRHYLSSRFDQSLLARRIEHHQMRAETLVEYHPESPMEMAGLVVYYDNGNYYFLKITRDDSDNKVVQVCSSIAGVYSEPGGDGQKGETAIIENDDPLYLRVTLDTQWYQFSYSTDGRHWANIGPRLNSTPLSDEYGNLIFKFTGSMVGIFACDVNEQGRHADFSHFSYEQLSADSKAPEANELQVSAVADLEAAS
ncbi:glycoside hydrolase 43 family protein [Microbulbifer agarilyticus]|uniref:Glycoside hydrolase 43 family protein n=1 Tax=Microbulbifer agarilyticus TaxID=260552 RepID=A0A1Q2M0W3_9GAMM|nr:glycoside hydrolase family 43 protein [Microbulbifer agarilyticus]AQQ66341.1 glycoside hydrolase 43 family protein [Microbulbifer agarilyticus]